MASTQPQSKDQEPTVIDLENGDRTARNTPSTTPETETSNSSTPEARNSHEFDNVRSHESPPWARVWGTIPPPLSRKLRKVMEWMKGPDPPRIYKIISFFEPIQTAPIRLLSRLPKLARTVMFIFAFGLWIALFAIIISSFSLPGDIAGYGSPVRLSCITRLWPDSQTCGLDGKECLPFDNHTLAFSCPADCGRVKVLNPRTIGDEQITYRSLVVGGTPDASDNNDPVYRGDSFICGSAIHAGILKDEGGGCGVLSLSGEKSKYGSIARNGILSVGFKSSFPLSFNFLQDEDIINSTSKCRDPRWNLLILSVIFTSLFSLFTTTPTAFFVPIFIIVYFQVSLASDPPAFADYPSAVSTAMGSLLPAAFIGVLIFHFSVRKTLWKLNAQIEKTVLWLGGCWVGALSNMTLDQIPIQRLTPHDLNQQPGAITALVFIAIILFCIGLFQAWCFRNEGRLPRYLAIYAVLGIGLLILLAIPELDLRIHHYILALLLLPGTALQTRPSLLYQGLLVGLFINGIARWGFASILQTEAALRGDAQLGRAIPEIHTPLISSTNITFTWEGVAPGYEGVSVLVNDVERFRGFHTDGDNSFSWTRHAIETLEYFRFGFVKYFPFGGIAYSDFTRAGIWQSNGSWTDIPPGLS
ncbi:LCCL domain protein [Zopfia rhizophila CBS 207.26]|uniref:LCCL domain protein n=1 Tax=Zopfia rhizophila CBS 207.26 TaxID=1314779 RepID=A0A6A6DJ66_9PEZI|nr:LCCL domain protein [Zopfia rhizophila CBS 207.26]